MSDHQASNYLTPTPVKVGLVGCCPRCGQGKLYQGLLQPAPRCQACKLDYAFIDAGDGPAVFVILIIGFVVTALALALHTTLSPPIWVQMILWVPVIIALSLWGLRFAKGIMISLQYTTKAREGQIT
jgi:uncharacterized protein (DUF983 family)